MTPKAKEKSHLQLVSVGGRKTSESREFRESANASLSSRPILEEVYRRFAPYVAAIAVRILGSEEDLDDLVQDVFLDATRGLSGLREPAAIKGWLAKITVRVAVRRLRQRRLRRALHIERVPIDYEAIIGTQATAEQRLLIIRVYRALESLPAQERAAWVLRYVQGESLDQGAAAAGCSVSTYQRRLLRANARLDQYLFRSVDRFDQEANRD